MVVSSLLASSSNELMLLLVLVVSAESEWSGERRVLFPPAKSMPKRRMGDLSLARGAGRMKGSWEKESTFMKSWSCL